MAEELESTPEQNPRNALLKGIADSANARAAADITPLEEDFEDKSARGEDATVKTAAPEPPKQPEMVTIKVDGVETQVTKEQAVEAGVRALQKESAADYRMAEAARIKKEYEDKIRQAAEAAPKPTPPDDSELIKLIQDAPFNDEAARKLAERVRPGAQPATPKIDDIAPQVERLVDIRLQGQRALEAFQSDYKDVVSDPNLLMLFQAKEQQLMSGGDTRPPLERWKQIGEELRAWRGPTTTLEDKAKRKETITNLPSASAKVEVPAEPKPKTASEIVEGMRRSRHQTV